MSWRRGISAVVTQSRVGVRRYSEYLDTLDLLTGIERKELCAHLAGNCDPFFLMPIKRGATAPGTREKPFLVPSIGPSRMVGCVCKPGNMHIEYICLHYEQPMRCGCGYWLKLIIMCAI